MILIRLAELGLLVPRQKRSFKLINFMDLDWRLVLKLTLALLLQFVEAVNFNALHPIVEHLAVHAH